MKDLDRELGSDQYDLFDMDIQYLPARVTGGDPIHFYRVGSARRGRTEQSPLQDKQSKQAVPKPSPMRTLLMKVYIRSGLEDKQRNQSVTKPSMRTPHPVKVPTRAGRFMCAGCHGVCPSARTIVGRLHT